MQKFAKNGKKGQKGDKNADFSRTDKSTVKPMVVGCVQHHSTHFIKLINTFFNKSGTMENYLLLIDLSTHI